MSRIEILLIHGRDGMIQELQSTGHAPVAGSSSLACGLVSSAVRSFGRLLANHPKLQTGLKLDGPGHFELRIGEIPPDLTLWYGGVCDLLKKNLSDAQADFPEFMHIELRNKDLEQEI